MADKTLSIKGASDKELDELIFRLRKENEAQNLLSDLKRKSASGYMPYDYGQEISTEKPIDSLYHFGILGMKWGKRRGATSVKSSHTNVSEDHITKLNLSTKSLSSMSNKDLKDLTTRLQLEKQYKDLTKKEVSSGRKFVNEVIGNAAKQTASTYVAKYMAKGVEGLLKKAAK